MDEPQEEMSRKRIRYAILQSLLGVLVVVLLVGIRYFRESNFPSFQQALFNLIFIPTVMFLFGFLYYPRYFRRREEFKKKMAALHEVTDFKCMKCGAVINPEEAKCTECGWTWNL